MDIVNLTRKFLTLVLVIGASVSLPTHAFAKPKVLEGTAKGTALIVAGSLPSHGRVDLVIEMAKPSSPEETKIPEHRPNWLLERGKRSGLVEKVKFLIRGESVGIPFSALADAHDVSTAALWEHGRVVYLRIQGGQGPMQFVTTYKVIRSKRIRGAYVISERSSKMGDKADALLEKTLYHDTIWDDPNM
jgi:hypothetical protein